MSDGSVSRQREYYRNTAQHYEAMHISREDENGFALALFSGYARLAGVRTVLDVGAGTGRALSFLGELLPEAEITGIEPVAELREVGHAKGIPADRLIAGDALDLPFPDDAFDFVIETGVLHHIPTPRRAVEEMVRVARHGVLISDSNKLGQGSGPVRLAKGLIDRLGLWPAMIWATTGGKMSKYNDGDGVFFSYSVFDDLAAVRRKFPRIHLVNTLPMPGVSLKHGAPHVACIALKEQPAEL